MIQKYPEQIDKTRGALFAGTFNPFTIGHADIVSRGVEMFGRVVICLGINIDKPDVEAPMRAVRLKELYARDPRVSVIWWAGLTTEAAKEHGCHVLLRGVRSVKDFEYERDMADINRQLSGLETVILYSLPELSAVSSSVVRELQAFGADVSAFLPTHNPDSTL